MMGELDIENMRELGWTLNLMRSLVSELLIWDGDVMCYEDAHEIVVGVTRSNLNLGRVLPGCLH
jgi:hypothetical protein